MSHVDEPTSESTGLSRRTLVRAGAHAAWMVPAVSIISSAPALAASAGTGTLTFTGTGTLKAGTAAWAAGSSSPITLSGTQITAASPTLTSTVVTLVVTFPILVTENNGGNGQTVPTGGAAAGWSAPSFGGAGTSANPYTATYTRTVTVSSGGSNTTFSPASYGVKRYVSGQSLTVSVTATGFTAPSPASVPITG